MFGDFGGGGGACLCGGKVEADGLLFEYTEVDEDGCTRETDAAWPSVSMGGPIRLFERPPGCWGTVDLAVPDLPVLSCGLSTFMVGFAGISVRALASGAIVSACRASSLVLVPS